jgi:hypothetical protein
MSQKPRFTHSVPLTADGLAALFDALALCETTPEALNEARAIIGKNGGDGSRPQGRRVNSKATVKPCPDHIRCNAVPSLQVS